MSFLSSLFSPTKKPDNRYHCRIPTGCRITMSWQDHLGKRRSASARVLDMNGSGALVRTGKSLVPGSYVWVLAKDLGLMGSALVRHCDAGMLYYKVGLQFPGSLTTRF